MNEYIKEAIEILKEMRRAINIDDILKIARFLREKQSYYLYPTPIIMPYTDPQYP